MGVSSLQPDRNHQTLPTDLVYRLRDGIASCSSTCSLSREARAVIAELCIVARNNAWTAEHLIVALTNAPTSSRNRRELLLKLQRRFSALLAACMDGSKSRPVDRFPEKPIWRTEMNRSYQML